ncbi:Selenoprotein [Trypanosoma melophagium]|uniref:Selenoprotein n=1 Tax=Trypanosoma melophagium TaxID=715481 RepID=UPI00351A0718|nr:Selenoprotein [Trypanosoma melophagium]
MVHHLKRSLPPSLVQQQSQKRKRKQEATTTTKEQHQQRPILIFEDAVYPVGPLRESLASLCSIGFIIALALGFAAPYFSAVLPPILIPWVMEHRGMIIAGGFLLNIIGSNLLQSGAFEVYLDNTLIYSKLQSGSVPPADALARIILEKIAAES